MMAEPARATAARYFAPAILAAACQLPIEGSRPCFTEQPGFTDTALARVAGDLELPLSETADSWYPEAMNEIENAGQLVDDWDGDGSIAPSPSVLMRASDALNHVLAANVAARRVLVTQTGGVGIYCFERSATPGRGARYFRIGLSQDGSTQFESGNLGSDGVEVVTAGAGDVGSLEQLIEDWVGCGQLV